MTETPPLTLDQLRDLVTAIILLREAVIDAVPPGLYRCRVCGGVGPWKSEVVHDVMPGDGPRARVCRVARAETVLGILRAHLVQHERHAGDTPIIDGG